MMFDLSLSKSAGSRSLGRLVRFSFHSTSPVNLDATAAHQAQIHSRINTDIVWRVRLAVSRTVYPFRQCRKIVYKDRAHRHPNTHGISLEKDTSCILCHIHRTATDRESPPM